MNDAESNKTAGIEEDPKIVSRRLFLQSLGKWSGAAIAAVLGSSWLADPPDTEAGGWINRRGGYGGGAWVNRGGGGGGWVNRYGGGGGGWVNRYGGGGGAWVNRYGGGGGWVNRW